MDNSNNSLTEPLNILNSTFIENNRKKWALKAASLRYKQEIEKLDIQMDMIKEDNRRIDDEIKQEQEQSEIFEKVYRTLKESLHSTQESLLIIKLHQDCVNEKMEKYKEEGDKILEEYNQVYEKRKEKLMKTNPLYKIITEKTIELKILQFNLRKIEHHIKEVERKKKQTFEIRQKIFYRDCVSLAKAWMEREKALKILKEKETEEKRLIKEHIDKSAKHKENKKKQEMNSIEKSAQNKQVSDSALKLMFAIPALSNNVSHQRNAPEAAVNNLLNHSLIPKIVHNENHFVNADTSSNHPTKIQILENVVISKKHSVVKDVDPVSQEEQSKALKAKLHKIVENFKTRRMSQRGINSSKSQTEKRGEVPEKKTEVEKEANVAPPIIPSQNNPIECGITQDINDLNILNQSSNVLNLLSQESGKNVQTKLNEFKHDPVIKPVVEKTVFEKPTDIEKAEKATKMNDELKFGRNGMNFSGTPYFANKLNENNVKVCFKNQQNNVVNEKTQPSTNIDTNKTFTHNFLKPSDDGKFALNAPSSLGAGFNPFAALQENTFLINHEKKAQTDNTNENLLFSVGSSANGFKPQSSKQYGFNQSSPFKRQKLENPQESNSVMDKPSGSMDAKNFESFAIDSQRIDNQTKVNDIQYNFGNITQFMENSTDMGDFSTSYVMSPDIPEQTPGMEIPISGPNFAFDKPAGALTFNFN